MVTEVEFDQMVQEHHGEWIATTRFAHLAKALKMAEKGEILRFGKLPFAQVARETGLHPQTVAHWYSLDYKRYLTPEFVILLDYYGLQLKDAIVLRLPDGSMISRTEVSTHER